MRKREEIEKDGFNIAQDGAENWRRAVLETLLDIRELQMPHHEIKYIPRSEIETVDEFEQPHELTEDDKRIFEEAEALARKVGYASKTLFQDVLRIGYVKSVQVMEHLEASGVIGPQQGSKLRKVL